MKVHLLKLKKRVYVKKNVKATFKITGLDLIVGLVLPYFQNILVKKLSMLPK